MFASPATKPGSDDRDYRNVYEKCDGFVEHDYAML